MRDIAKSGRALVAAAAVIVAAAASAATSSAPQASAGQASPPASQGRGTARGGGGNERPAPLNLEDRAGFESIFDGKSMKNWDGDPTFWKVENGELVGQSTAEHAVKENTFLIWRGGEPADFELKVQFRINSTNSGIQFRSVHLPQGTKDGTREIAGKWVLKGYQADIDFDNSVTGMIYEERGRAWIAPRGTVGYIAPDGAKKTLGNLERTANELKAAIKSGDWNDVHLIARGNTLVNIVNGHVTCIVIDDDAKNRKMKGLLGFQMHQGAPMKVEFRNIYMKKL
jgi:hypothetical protein